jgi:hypothetical protein
MKKYTKSAQTNVKPPQMKKTEDPRFAFPGPSSTRYGVANASLIQLALFSQVGFQLKSIVTTRELQSEIYVRPIEQPVCGCSHRQCFGTELERIDLTRNSVLTCQPYSRSEHNSS